MRVRPAHGAGSLRGGDVSDQPQKQKIAPADVVAAVVTAPFVLLDQVDRKLKRMDDDLKDWFWGDRR